MTVIKNRRGTHLENEMPLTITTITMKREKGDEIVLRESSSSKRKLPINIESTDLELFTGELQAEIPDTLLLQFKNVDVAPDGIIFQGNKMMSEVFPSLDSLRRWENPKRKMTFFLKNSLFSFRQKKMQEAFWITDIWSHGYFHWLTDALPRLFTIRDRLGRSALLLPERYRKQEFILSSLKAFSIKDVRFAQKITRCENLKMPTHTAPTGNYNEGVIRELRRFYRDFYQASITQPSCEKIYISRSNAGGRKVVNESECISVMEDFGFQTFWFEEYSFEQQVKIALSAKYLISNHGAGLTNMMFMNSGCRVLEFRKTGDSQNNCYFALASALNLDYFYQLCHPKDPYGDSHAGNLVVNCELLKKNIEKFLNDEKGLAEGHC